MISIFENNHGQEIFVALEAEIGLAFEQALNSLLNEYSKSIRESKLAEDSAVLIRFHISDAHTQTAILRQTLEDYCHNALISIIEQPPASGSKVAMEAYHIVSYVNDLRKQLNDDCLIIGHGTYESQWGILHSKNGNGSPYHQTCNILDVLSSNTKKLGGCIKDNVIRTWFYVRDIDNNYSSMVDARREWFKKVGMTKDTHYIASTGIEGKTEHHSDLVVLNYLSVMGLQEEQIHFMSALNQLCPTHKYNVTFERGTRIAFGDRSHYHISGTASIDRQGEVLHIGNVIKQTERTIENISSLLEEAGASFDDMKLIVVYLRDRSDYMQVQQYLQQHLSTSTAHIIVKGAVCRTDWLIEMDGIAVTEHRDNRFEPFC